MAGIEELLGEFQEVGREWEAHEDRLLDLLKELIDALEDSSTRLCLVYSALNFAGLTLVPQELQKRVAAQPDCWKGLHAKLSKFGKIVEKVLGKLPIPYQFVEIQVRRDKLGAI